MARRRGMGCFGFRAPCGGPSQLQLQSAQRERGGESNTPRKSRGFSTRLQLNYSAFLWFGVIGFFLLLAERSVASSLVQEAASGSFLKTARLLPGRGVPSGSFPTVSSSSRRRRRSRTVTTSVVPPDHPRIDPPSASAAGSSPSGQIIQAPSVDLFGKQQVEETKPRRSHWDISSSASGSISSLSARSSEQQQQQQPSLAARGGGPEPPSVVVSEEEDSSGDAKEEEDKEPEGAAEENRLISREKRSISNTGGRKASRLEKRAQALEPPMMSSAGTLQASQERGVPSGREPVLLLAKPPHFHLEYKSKRSLHIPVWAWILIGLVLISLALGCCYYGTSTT